MALPRPQKPEDPDEGIRNHLIGFLDATDADLDAMEPQFKERYWYFWPKNWSKEDTQKHCDMLAAMPFEDTNMLIYTFSKTYNRYLYIKGMRPGAFADGRTDPQGRMSPGGVVYMEYLTPPWEFEWRQDGGITLLGDAQIDFNPPVEPVDG